MFVNMLTDEEKIGFVSLMQYLSQVDGMVTEDEKLYLEGFCREIGVKDTETNCDFSAISIKEILALIKTPVSKNVIIMELINLAYADEDYSTKKRNGIKYIANVMGVLEGKIIEIEEWVKEGISWANRGYYIISSSEGDE